MSNQTRVRARWSQGQMGVAVLVRHPMASIDPRSRNDDAGHYIDRMEISVNGVLAAEFYMSPGIAANPLTCIHLKGTKIGDRLTVRWTDTKGHTGHAETTLSQRRIP